MRWLLFTLLLACGDTSSDPPSTSDTTDTTDTTDTSEPPSEKDPISTDDPIDCEGLDEATCDGANGCTVHYGAPMHGEYTCDNMGHHEYAGCTTGDGLCPDYPVAGTHPDAPDEYWFFGDSCVPDGWTAHVLIEVCPEDPY